MIRMLPRTDAAQVDSDKSLARGIAPRAVAGIAVALCLAVLLLAYWPTFASMVAVWLRSDTHAHGIVAAPIALWLAWRQRSAVGDCAIRPSTWALGGLLGLGLIWLLSSAALALVTEQLAVVAMAPAILWCIAGSRMLRTLSFPCAYLIFLVPFGEPLIAPLSELTATITVSLLRFSGIDVFREGLFFSTKVGDFEVARSCSGIRYLTASVAVGTLFAHLSFGTLRYKVRFVALCAIVPVVANGLRAYLIVVLAHVSNMSIAVDVDHIVYGWLFFGLVMLGLFWIGRLMHSNERAIVRAAQGQAPSPRATESAGAREISLMFLATVTTLIVAPLLARQLEARALDLVPIKPTLPRVAGDWSGPHATSGDWAPEFHGAHQLLLGSYRRTGALAVDLAVISYTRQTEDAELIGHENRLEDAARWRVLAETERTVGLGDDLALPVSETIAASTSRGVYRVIWSLFRIGRHRTANAYFGKAMQGINSILDPAAGAALIAFSVEDVDAKAARARLEQFLIEHYGAIERCVDGGREVSATCTVLAHGPGGGGVQP